MITALFAAGIIGYLLVASLPFTRLPVQFPVAYYTAGIVLGAGLNCLWLTIARNVPLARVVTYGVMWDAMLTLIYVVTPILIWSQPSSFRLWAGVSLIIAGMVIAKT